HQPVENLEVVSVAADEPGAYYFGLVDLLMMVVVLNQAEHLAKRRARDEHVPHPVVNEAAGSVDFAAGGVSGHEAPHENHALLEFAQDVGAARFRKLIDVEKISGVGNLLLNAGLRQADASREGFNSLRLQVGAHNVL